MPAWSLPARSPVTCSWRSWRSHALHVSVLLLASTTPQAGRAAAEGPVPAAAVAEAMALLSEAARALAPAGARVQALPGRPDPRLKLAPCTQVQAALVPGAPPWGRTRVGLRCQDGTARWSITLPATVQVWAPAAVARTALAAGATLQAEHLDVAEVDWAAAAQAPQAEPAALAGRVLARSVPAGQALRAPDLQSRQWFAAGETVRVIAGGPGFAISTEGQAVTAGLEGQRVRVRVGENRVVDGRNIGPRWVEGRAVGPRTVEVGP